MQDEQQRLRPCRDAGPAAKPPGVDDGGDDQNNARGIEIGKQRPSTGRHKHADRRLCQAAGRRDVGLTSQLRVKLGMMRPPMTEISRIGADSEAPAETVGTGSRAIRGASADRRR